MSEENIRTILNSNKTALDENQITAYCNKNNIAPFKIIVLSQLEEELNNLPLFTFIFTGQEPDNFNKGYKQHWILLVGNHLFDSYGHIDKYNIPESIQPVITHPARLQEYGSAVCGHYCLAVAYFATNNKYDEDNLGTEIVAHYGFQTIRKRNDEIVLSQYDETK